jgi:hypothetical protein
MTDTLTNIAKRHAVIVSDGSGVLIQPATEEYSYVLTAKHVVDSFIDVGKIDVFTLENKKVEVIDTLIHPKFDVAILKVPKQEDLDLIRYTLDSKLNETLWLYGFPKRKRGNRDTKTKLDSYHLTIHDIDDDKLSIRNTEPSNYEDVEGYSGGALCRLDENLNLVFLVGIENQMDDAEALNGRMCGTPISIYAEYLVENNWAALDPLHLISFKYSQDKIFKSLTLEREESLNCLRQFLKLLLDSNNIKTSDVITPRGIITRFKKLLLAYKQIIHVLHQSELWVWFLEFLSIQLLLSPPQKNKLDWEAEYLDDIFSSFRFVYAHEKVNYKRILSQLILPTDLSGMNAECKIIIFANGQHPPSPILALNVQERTLTDISLGLERPADITIVMKNQGMTNPIIHWPKLSEDCLAADENEAKFSELNIINNKKDIAALITGGYGEVLKGDN